MRSASRWSRTRRTPSRAATAAASSAGSSDATCFSLYATKNVAAGEGGLVATNRDDVAERDPEHAAHAAGPRVALRPGHVRASRRTSRTSSPRSRSSSSTSSSTHAAIRARQFGLYDDGLADLDGISPLARRSARHTCASSLRRPDRRSAGGRDARRLSAGAARRADRDQHPLPAGAPPDVVPRAVSGAAAATRRGAGGRRGALAAALARALRRGHPRRGRCRPPRPRPVHGVKPAARDTD